MNRGMEAMGGKICKRYRVYQRELGRGDGARAVTGARMASGPIRPEGWTPLRG
jgi:hypothetical protein